MLFTLDAIVGPSIAIGVLMIAGLVLAAAGAGVGIYFIIRSMLRKKKNGDK